MSKLLAGPLLGLERDNLYTLCFVTERAAENPIILLQAGEKTVGAKAIGETHSGTFWRASFPVTPTAEGQFISYAIHMGPEEAQDQNERSAWQFYVPGTAENPRMAYTSCNGFSNADYLTKNDAPMGLWEEMATRHSTKPFSLLMMGGDQLYADSIWTDVASLVDWTQKKMADRIRAKATQVMLRQLDAFYDRMYRERWKDEHLSYMLASVPSIMMWDDHDIFDGWGSYPEEIQTCPVYQAIFAAARKYFEWFQIRSLENTALLAPEDNHYAQALQFRHYHVLALDNRSERTRKHIMSESQWMALLTWLEHTANAGDLLVLSAVPVVYRDFGAVESTFDATPWEETLTDDIKDHWRALEHQGERLRLIMRLLRNTRARNQGAEKGRTVILSGDVHVGCLGVINDRSAQPACKIHQVVSSGIVHPPPSPIQWLGIQAITNDRDEFLNEEQTIQTSMLRPVGAPKYLRTQNFATLHQGTDDKLWVNWICKGDMEPVYPLE